MKKNCASSWLFTKIILCYQCKFVVNLTVLMSWCTVLVASKAPYQKITVSVSDVCSLIHNTSELLMLLLRQITVCVSNLWLLLTYLVHGVSK
jgi:hypothetical protein